MDSTIDNPVKLRNRMLEVVSKTGGHLASSLGAVEIAMALAEVFDPSKDRVVWDVGHQAYAWKMLSGRNDRFDTLRQMGGVSGFPNPSESDADAAVAGHAGVALSVAAGLAAARDQRKSHEHVIAVVGDASMANGVSFEALNNCAAATTKMIVVLNDNEMSISRPTGSFARLLGRLITGVRYNRFKMAAEKIGHALRLTFLRGIYHSLERRVKSLFLGNAFFEQFGLRYIGPVDGHDLQALRDAFTVAKEDKRSVLVHVVTKKGHGYAPAEKNPTKWHGVGPFDLIPKVESSRPVPKKRGWSDVFGDALCEIARKDKRVVAITAAMKDGTGLVDFASEFPARFFDVGIAEEHMVAFAAGLAAGGSRPVVAVYSTFLQRAVDQVMHDVCLSNQPVVFCVDSAGVVGADGATHQGVFDIAMLRCLPNITICQPKDADDLRLLMLEALVRKGPTVIRYPRGAAPEKVEAVGSVADDGCARFAIWATGDWLGKANEVARLVGGCEVTFARYLKPFDSATLERQRKSGMTIVSLENGSIAGGFGESIGADVKFGWPDEFIPHGSQAELEKKYGLDAASIADALRRRVR